MISIEKEKQLMELAISRKRMSSEKVKEKMLEILMSDAECKKHREEILMKNTEWSSAPLRPSGVKNNFSISDALGNL